MASAPADWVEIVLALPPQLQGIVVAVGGGLGSWLLYRRFKSSYQSPEPEPKGELLVGESATFADLKPIKDLVDQMNLMTLQMMKNEVGLSQFIGEVSKTTQALISARVQAMEASDRQQQELMRALKELADLLAQHLVDLRTEREEREDKEREAFAREEGRLAGIQEAMTTPARKRPTVRTRVIKKG